MEPYVKLGESEARTFNQSIKQQFVVIPMIINVPYLVLMCNNKGVIVAFFYATFFFFVIYTIVKFVNWSSYTYILIFELN